MGTLSRDAQARRRARTPDRRFTARQLEGYRLRRHVNVIGDVGWDVLVAEQVLGRVYPVNVPAGTPIPRGARWTVALPPDFVYPIHDIRRAAASKEQAVGDLFRKLRLEPREWDTTGTPIWARP